MAKRRNGRQVTSDSTVVAGYIRVSTEEQAGSGLGMEAQRDAITSECDRRGWTLLRVFEDAGASGKTVVGREALQAALAAVEAGDAGALVVAKLDRLSRSLLDFAALMEQARKQGWAIVALDLGLDMTTPSGALMANVMASFSEFERRMIGVRTKEALAVKKRQGVRLGRQRLVSDDVVDRILRYRNSGEGLSGIARLLNEQGVPTAGGGARWYPSTIRAIVLAHTTHA